MTYQAIKDAAELRQGGDSSGAWALADALVAELGDVPMGPTPESSADVGTRLATIAARLEADGIETPSGEPYSTATLRRLRLVAMGWPVDQRLPEAAFRTHQETGSDDPWRREVLRVLCLAARTRDWTQPPMNTAEIDGDAWARAVLGVQRKVESHTRYPVAANDLRAALRRKINLPERDLDEENATVLDAIEDLHTGMAKFDRAVRILARRQVREGDAAEAVLAMLPRLEAMLLFIRSLVDGGAITDEALAEFISSGPES